MLVDSDYGNDVVCDGVTDVFHLDVVSALFSDGLKIANQSGICVRLIESKKDFILFCLEIILEGKRGIVIIIVMSSQKVDVSVCDSLTTLEPPLSFSFLPSSRKNGDGHALPEKRGFFGQVGKSEPSYTCPSVAAPEEKPIIVAIGIDIVLDQKVVLPLFGPLVGTANVPALEISINPVRDTPACDALLRQLAKVLPVVVDKRINALEPAQKSLPFLPRPLQSVVETSELLALEVLLEWQVFAIHDAQLQSCGLGG